ncbi:DarT ssDNA thymidine ADP-ribosyltransferase family protein [Rouxiella silvae]|uniref:DarT ssDNA thymidine ADP-ribosyltransferase family protein n=1 Tax=Rouxiella silvae TaxID=1646373 RepID=UPI0039EEDBB3
MASQRLIQNQSLLYHLTCMDNLPSILKNGLCSREALGNTFVDVADGEIIRGRGAHNLQRMVPFHFFGNNPFDGRVKADHSEKEFCMITVNRQFAKDNNWKIITRHPLASQSAELMDYCAGFADINWDSMNLREYRNAESKSVCMAECLSPNTVHAQDFHCFYVKDDKSKSYVEGLLKEAKLSKFVNINTSMC